jgi:transposase-like protein
MWLGKHHSSNYKESAIRYYKKCKNLRKTCKIYECKKSTLERWIKRYDSGIGIGLNRKPDKRERRIVTNDIIKFIKKTSKKRTDNYTYPVKEID